MKFLHKSSTLSAMSRAKYLPTLFLLISFLASAQDDSGVSNGPESLSFEVFDRKGSQYQLSEIKIDSIKGSGSSSKTVLSVCQPGIFSVYFESGSGMEDNSGEHVERRAVLCRVLQDISDFLISPLHDPINTAKVNIWVRDISQVDLPAGIMGFGSSFYTVPQGSSAVVGGIADGEIWKTIHAGADSYADVTTPFVTGNLSQNTGAFYHGLIAVDFASYNWHTNLQSPPEIGYYDLYTFLLKEVAHALGLASLVSADGSSVIETGGAYYSRYDRFLKNSSGQFLIANAGACSSLYDYGFTGSASDLAPGCSGAYTTNQTICSTAIQFAGTTPVAVYTPACFEELFSLSHFEDECFPLGSAYGNDAYFATANALQPETVRRVLTVQERQALCDLGYSVKPIFGNGSNGNFYDYGTATCAGINVAGINDGINGDGTYAYVGGINTPIAITGDSILGNDRIGPTSEIAFECLEDVYDGSTVFSATGGGELTTLTVTCTTAGVHLLRYIPFDVTTGQRGNITYIHVYVTSEPNCSSPDLCNLVVNGNFEDFSTLATGTNSILHACGWFAALNTSPNYFNGSNSTVPCNQFGHQTAASGSGYAGMWVLSPSPTVPSSGETEIIRTKLIQPLAPNTRYRFSVKVALAEAASRYRTSFQAYLSTGFVGNTNGWLNLDPGTGILLEGPDVTLTTGWQTFTVEFESGEGGQEYIYLGRLTQPTLTNLVSVPSPVSGCSFNNYNAGSWSFTGAYWYVDDVTLEPIIDGTFSLPEFICEGQVIEDLSEYLSDIPPTGVFSGPGVTENGGIYSFDPGSVIFGGPDFTITYVYSNNLGCEQTLEDHIEELDSDDPQCGCQNNLTLNTPQIGSQELYQRHEWILADDGYQISGSQNITMKAGDFIQFNPATSFVTATQFLAYIEDCCESCRIYAVKESVPMPVKSLQLQPNPTKGELSVQLVLDGHSARRISVVSFDGRIILDKEISKTNGFTLDVSSYADGMYIMNITADDGNIYSEKFIKD